MLAQGRGQIDPLNLWHLFTERHASQRFLNAFSLGRVRGCAESVRQFEEFVLFGFFRLDSSFDQLHQDAVCAGAPILRNCSHAPGKAGRKGYALAHSFFSSGHGAIVHHNEAMCTNLTVPFRTYSCGRGISHYCGPKRDSSLRSE